MRRADIICAGLFFALGLLTLLFVIPTYVAAGIGADDLSPAFMPYVATLLGTGAAALLLVTRLAPRGSDDEPAPLPLRSWYFIGIAAVVLAATFVLMERFGYLAGATAIVAGFMALARADLKIMIGVTIALPITLWLLFDRLLGFPLP